MCSLLALLFAQDNLWDCSDKGDVLKEIPVDVNIPSACTLQCTAQTYQAVLALKDKLMLHFKDSYAGEVSFSNLYNMFILFENSPKIYAAITDVLVHSL